MRRKALPVSESDEAACAGRSLTPHNAAGGTMPLAVTYAALSRTPTGRWETFVTYEDGSCTLSVSDTVEAARDAAVVCGCRDDLPDGTPGPAEFWWWGGAAFGGREVVRVVRYGLRTRRVREVVVWVYTPSGSPVRPPDTTIRGDR